MSDATNMLKAELGLKTEEHSPQHHHHHDKVVVPSQESNQDVTHVLQSQLGHGKEVDQEVQQEKEQPEGK